MQNGQIFYFYLFYCISIFIQTLTAPIGEVGVVPISKQKSKDTQWLSQVQTDKYGVGLTMATSFNILDLDAKVCHQCKPGFPNVWMLLTLKDRGNWDNTQFYSTCLFNNRAQNN